MTEPPRSEGPLGGQPGPENAMGGTAAPPPPGYQHPQPPIHHGQPVYVVQQTRTNGLAIAALVLGIIWIYWLGSILAVIFGHVALGQINRSGGTQSGRGLAIAGLVLGWIGVGVLLLLLLIGGASLV